jgi:hypothetical protein
MSASNHPVRFLGPQSFRRMPIAHLSDVQAASRLALERDLREAPTPISGGMRKALNKELGAQSALRFRTRRRYCEAELGRAYGLLEATCGFCRHTMFFDEVEDAGFGAIRCDRCRRPI